MLHEHGATALKSLPGRRERLVHPVRLLRFWMLVNRSHFLIGVYDFRTTGGRDSLAATRLSCVTFWFWHDLLSSRVGGIMLQWPIPHFQSQMFSQSNVNVIFHHDDVVPFSLVVVIKPTNHNLSISLPYSVCFQFLQHCIITAFLCNNKCSVKISQRPVAEIIGTRNPTCKGINWNPSSS